MFYVAVCELSRPLEREEAPIAAVVGLSAYDVRIRLGGVLPRVIAQAQRVEAALATAEALRARGHGVVVLSGEEAVSFARMPLMRRFNAEGGILFSNDRRPPSRPLVDLVAIVHAAMHVRVERTTREVVYRPSPRGTYRDDEQRTTGEQTLEQIVLLFFRDEGARGKVGVPWLLRPSEARYLALGPALRPTIHENFLAAIEWLKARSPNAVFDDRFARQPLAPQRVIGARDNDAASPLGSDRGVEIVLHALGAWLGRSEAGPYR